MLRAQFDQRNTGLVLKLEGRLVSAWAVQVKSLVSRRFVRNGLFVDMSEVTYVDSAGEQLLLWLRDLQAKFVAETCYARDICQRLHLALKGDADRPRPVGDRGASLVPVAPHPRPGGHSDSPGRGPLMRSSICHASIHLRKGKRRRNVCPHSKSGPGSRTSIKPCRGWRS